MKPVYSQIPGSSPLIVDNLVMSRIVTVNIIVMISLVLSLRPMYVAPDDANYLAYFAGDSFHPFSSIWAFLVEEPLWTFYARSIGSMLGPELALRVTIFISTVCFFIACIRLAPNARLFIIIAFIVDVTLATQLYYNQIRQGFALSVFLAGCAFGLTPIVGAFLASLFHTSFFLMFLCLIVIKLAPKKQYFWLAISIIAILILYVPDVLSYLHLGRRAETYAIKNKFTIMHYFVNITLYATACFILKPDIRDEAVTFWYPLTILYVLASLELSYLFEFGGRLMYISGVLMIITIGQRINKSRVSILAVAWILALILLGLNEGMKLNFNGDTWFGRWLNIIS